MSERFVLQTTQEELEHQFKANIDQELHFESDFNISAGAIQPVIIQKNEQPNVEKAKWGLIPPGADEERAGKDNCLFGIDNLDKEEWPVELIETQRTLIPASGFYKWKSTEKKTTPFYVRMLSDDLMALGGIYNQWKSASGREIYSFAVLTTESNALIEPVDDRMPIVVMPQSYKAWLNADIPSQQVLEEINNYPSMLTQMIVNRVTDKINDINNNGAELIQPIPK